MIGWFVLFPKFALMALISVFLPSTLHVWTGVYPPSNLDGGGDQKSSWRRIRAPQFKTPTMPKLLVVINYHVRRAEVIEETGCGLSVQGLVKDDFAAYAPASTPKSRKGNASGHGISDHQYYSPMSAEAASEHARTAM
jgi:hypothetical protein